MKSVAIAPVGTPGMDGKRDASRLQRAAWLAEQASAVRAVELRHVRRAASQQLSLSLVGGSAPPFGPACHCQGNHAALRRIRRPEVAVHNARLMSSCTDPETAMTKDTIAPPPLARRRIGGGLAA